MKTLSTFRDVSKAKLNSEKSTTKRLKFDWEYQIFMVQVVEKGKFNYYHCNETTVQLRYHEASDGGLEDIFETQFVFTCNCNQVLGVGDGCEVYMIKTLLDYDWTDQVNRTDDNF